MKEKNIIFELYFSDSILGVNVERLLFRLFSVQFKLNTSAKSSERRNCLKKVVLPPKKEMPLAQDLKGITYDHDD